MNTTLNRFVKKNWGWLVVLAVIVAIVYRFKFMPVDVGTVPAASGEIVAEVMGTGTLEARFQTTISSKIQGRLAEVLRRSERPRDRRTTCRPPRRRGPGAGSGVSREQRWKRQKKPSDGSRPMRRARER